MRPRPSGILAAATATAIIAAAALSGPAVASPWDPHVQMSGHIQCSGAISEPTWMWYWTDHGDEGWATLSNHGAPKWANVAGRMMAFITIKGYTINLWNVPKDGTTLRYKIGCKNSLGSREMPQQQYGVNRPTFGTKGTRHICFDQVFSCIQ